MVTQLSANSRIICRHWADIFRCFIRFRIHIGVSNYSGRNPHTSLPLLPKMVSYPSRLSRAVTRHRFCRGNATRKCIPPLMSFSPLEPFWKRAANPDWQLWQIVANSWQNIISNSWNVLTVILTILYDRNVNFLTMCFTLVCMNSQEHEQLVTLRYILFV